MRKASRILPAAIAGLSLTWAACGDSNGPGGGANTGDPLTTAEAQELASEVFDVLFSIGLTGSPRAAAPIDVVDPIVRFSLAAAAEPIPTTTAPCEGGGSITVSGDVNVSGNGQSSSFDIVEDINNCQTTGSSGTTFTINGDPNVRMTGSVDANSDFSSITIDLNIGGGIAFSTSDNRSGTCAISISMGGTVNLSNLSNPNAISISGSVCGQSITTL